MELKWKKRYLCLSSFFLSLTFSLSLSLALSLSLSLSLSVFFSLSLSLSLFLFLSLFSLFLSLPLSFLLSSLSNTFSVQIQEKMRRSNLQLVGWYHSHPSNEATPSLNDVTQQLVYQESLAADDKQHPCIAIVTSKFFGGRSIRDIFLRCCGL